MDQSRALRGNLPAPLTSFVGREAEIQSAIDLLATTRLLTLTGSGGIGKTRLGLAVAAVVAGLYGGGVWLVELAGLANPALLAQAVAAALGVPEAGGRPLLDVLVDTIAERPLLLVLDNCEHLLDDAAVLARSLLLRCPELKVLATSRQPLGLEGETVSLVPPLSLPDIVPGPSALGAYEATALFLARARAGHPAFATTSRDAEAIGEICRRLDGIPLAIELAAAWVKTLSVEEIASHLDDRFHLLRGGSRTTLPRQQTLRGALDWSFELLTESEQVLFRRLAVFEGGWTLEAVESVCTSAPLTKDEALPLLRNLVDKSLVLAERETERTRYRFLETTREYALERLAGAEETRDTRTRHTAFFVERVEQLERLIFGREQLRALHELDLEQDNVRAAMRCAVERGNADAELRLVASLWDYWWMRGHLTEGRSLVEAALLRGPEASSRTRAKTLHGAAILAAIQGDLEYAFNRFTESVQAYRDVADSAGASRPLGDLATTYAFLGDSTRAQELAQEAVRLAQDMDERWALAYARHMCGQIALHEGRYRPAIELSEHAAEIWREIGDNRGLAHDLVQLSIALRQQGNIARAIELAREALALFDGLGETWGIAGSLVVIAAAAERLGEVQPAARILSAEDAFARKTGISLVIPHWQRDFDSTVDAAREALGSEAFAAAWSTGAKLSIEEAIAYALTGRLPEPAPEHGRPTPSDLARLTQREREVAMLVAGGMTDQDISTHLVISRRTAENHVHHVLLKLGFHSRADLIDWAPRLGLKA
jgi:non-specific serine/threonine protein kinase